ncbi:MAG: sensor histidine kinase [Halobacteriaceae archaeon]
MERGINYSGLVIAAIGFGLTRFTVTLAIYETPIRFYLAGVLPLALGLGLAAFGVALTIATVDPTVVRTTAAWCVIGLATMLGVAALTILGSGTWTGTRMQSILSQAYLSNFLIVGSIGGTLTGLYAARHRRQRRAVDRHANTLVVLNRLLRHEVLNAITAIRGYALLDGESRHDPDAVVEAKTDAVVDTIEEVKSLTTHTQPSTTPTSITVRASLADSVSTVEARHPDADVTVPDVDDGLAVRATDHLSTVLTHLLDNAIVHGTDPTPRVAVDADRSTIQIAITDTGPGLPDPQRALLESGDIEQYDDPQTGFGLNLVRLFVDGAGGDIDTTVTAAGTTVTVTLPRAAPDHSSGPAAAVFTRGRPATPHLLITVTAAILAGIAYGAVSTMLGGSIAGIGVLYGTADPVVGWLTHEFHSIVFGLVYVGLLTVAPPPFGTGRRRFLTVGVAWSLILWAGAAGVVAPIWLQLIGITATVPTLSTDLLASHLAWGVTLAVTTAFGYRYLLPWLR